MHAIEDFDGARKSCRVQLDKHNLRRRCRRKSQTKTPTGYTGMEGGGEVNMYARGVSIEHVLLMNNEQSFFWL